MTNNYSEEDQIIPNEGWHVIHLFYQIDHAQWSILSEEEQLKAKTDLTKLIQDIRSTPNTQLLSFSIVTPKTYNSSWPRHLNPQFQLFIHDRNR